MYVLRKRGARGESQRDGEFRKFNRWTFRLGVKDDSFGRFVNRVTPKVFRFSRLGDAEGLGGFGHSLSRHIDPFIFVLILARRHVAITSILLNY